MGAEVLTVIEVLCICVTPYVESFFLSMRALVTYSMLLEMKESKGSFIGSWKNLQFIHYCLCQCMLFTFTNYCL